MPRADDKQFELDFDQLPTSTVHQARLQMFESSRRPKNTEREIVTAWGTAVVKGKLGQGHADVLEAMFHEAEDWRRTDEGQFQLLVDPYKLRTVANGGKQGSHEQLVTVLKDIMAAVIDLKIHATRKRVLGHIIDQVVESPTTAPNPLDGKERHLWRVTVGPAFVGLLGGDLHLHYDPKPIAALGTGIAQAVARHVATHRNQPPGGWHLDGLIHAVGAGGTSVAMRNRRREIGKDAEGLRALGLVIEGGRLRRISDE